MKVTYEKMRRGLRRLNQSFGVFDDKIWVEFGINYATSQILFILDELEEPTARNILEILKIEKYTLSRYLSKLHDMKVIISKNHPTDSRSKLILLTVKGKSLLNKINDFANEKTDFAIGGLSKEEIKIVEEAFELIEKNLIRKSNL